MLSCLQRAGLSRDEADPLCVGRPRCHSERSSGRQPGAQSKNLLRTIRCLPFCSKPARRAARGPAPWFRRDSLENRCRTTDPLVRAPWEKIGNLRVYTVATGEASDRTTMMLAAAAGTELYLVPKSKLISSDVLETGLNRPFGTTRYPGRSFFMPFMSAFAERATLKSSRDGSGSPGPPPKNR